MKRGVKLVHTLLQSRSAMIWTSFAKKLLKKILFPMILVLVAGETILFICHFWLKTIWNTWNIWNSPTFSGKYCAGGVWKISMKSDNIMIHSTINNMTFPKPKWPSQKVNQNTVLHYAVDSHIFSVQRINGLQNSRLLLLSSNTLDRYIYEVQPGPSRIKLVMTS